MPTCDCCGKEAYFPHRCKLCLGEFCEEHMLPENHRCPLEPIILHPPRGKWGRGESEPTVPLKKPVSYETAKMSRSPLNPKSDKENGAIP